MDDIPLIPPHLVQLGLLLAPVLQEAGDALQAAPAARGLGPLTPAEAQRHLGQVREFTSGITAFVNDSLAPFAADASEPVPQAARVARQLDTLLERYIRRYREVLAAAGPARPVRNASWYLLAQVYRHHLVEVYDWLEEFLCALNEPERYFRNRTSPRVRLELELNPAPELLELEASLYAEYGRSGLAGKLGFWGTLGAVVLGLGLGKMLFGDKGEQ